MLSLINVQTNTRSHLNHSILLGDVQITDPIQYSQLSPGLPGWRAHEQGIPICQWE